MWASSRREPYTNLANVIAISICDFTLWPDDVQDCKQLPRVPMLSRWNMQEQGSGSIGLLQVQYVFLELPKLRNTERPGLGAPLWAWLFAHARELHAVPDDLPVGPFRSALELANESTFSLTELEAYQKVMDEIQQAREYGDAREMKGEVKGKAEGLVEGEVIGKILAYCEMLGVEMPEPRRASLSNMELAALLTLLEFVKRERRWPD